MGSGEDGGLSQLPGVSQEQQPSWTDDLPLCHLSGVGSASNRSYAADGKGIESHPPEDSWLKFRYVWRVAVPDRESQFMSKKRVCLATAVYRGLPLKWGLWEVTTTVVLSTSS